MSVKKQLYIHIGSRKTGTTALQHFFTHSRDILLQKGVTYPDVEGKSAPQHRLPQSLMADVGEQWWFPKNLKDCQKEWGAVLGQINTPIGLISSEYFFIPRISRPEYVAKIRELTTDFDVKIVAYIRRQEGVFQSEYNQVVKAGARDANSWVFKDFFNMLKQGPIFNYIQILDCWADVFGKENIIVRPYEKQQFYGGNIFSDFLHYAFELTLTDEFSLPEGDPNIRLHRIALEYKRLVNHLCLSHEQRKLIIEPLRGVSTKLNEDGRLNYTVQSPQEQRALIQEYATSNKAIAQKFLNREDGQLFYDPLPDINDDWEPYDILLERDARYINEYITINWPGVRDLIICGIINARNSSDDDIQKAARFLLPGLVKSKSELSTTKNVIDQVYFSSRIGWRVNIHCIYLKIRDKLRKFGIALAKKTFGTKILYKMKTKILF